MRLEGDLPFRGEIVWLTPEQGGRTSGPPLTPNDQDYAATAYVPPASVENGSTSFVLRVEDGAAWRSAATAAWLAVQNEGVHQVGAGTVLVVADGSRDVAYFRVHQIMGPRD